MNRPLAVLALMLTASASGVPPLEARAAQTDETTKVWQAGLRLYVYTPRAKEPCDLPLAQLVDRRSGQLSLRRVYSAFEVTWTHGTIKVSAYRRAHEDLGDLDARPQSGQCFVLDHGDSEPIRGMVLQPQSERLLRGPALVLQPAAEGSLAFRLLPSFPASLGDAAPTFWSTVLKD